MCVVTYLFCACRYAISGSASYDFYQHVHVLCFDLRYAYFCGQTLLQSLIHLPLCLHVADIF